ncbi:S-M checkpoint control protein rad4 [Fusarium oxysporum f. sp. rapae]|uniref:S-M checkpoint control protein rad4 n=1 Tax=Fusarium oxysporum f. sp. rapae TaxID=485398 RepID=A0A8J5TUZ2_FUSOX|nr:S-M checkpoint control protein rad4 [Fusarium oxysporum f. sp. rapae]
MTSPRANEEEDIQIDPAEPLKGIVVCCTSIPAEHRTSIASKVAELGGIHKYDLTPDVTHLIVGDYDTPKYRHVARERPDIKAMDAAWIEELSEIWKNDEEIDYRQLENKHQLKPLEKRGIDPTVQPQRGEPARDSLLICLTGFGDQRDEIANKITSNGGLYTGDLTRRCTHLIVNKPEGKKYTAARAWGIHPVTLAWLEQSISRRMILEEAKFDPTLPPEEQGKGAWVTRELKRTMSKRSKSAIAGGAEEGPRKLRKTASMKLSSQRNNIWGDILGRSTSRDYSFAQENKEDGNQAQVQQPQRAEAQPEPPAPIVPEEDQGIFGNCYFYIHGFNAQRTSVLEQTLVTLGATICSSLNEAALGRTPKPPRSRFLIVPQTSQPNTHPQETYDNLHVVTEYYIEKCLHNKQYFDPGEHVLGRPFTFFPIPAFSDLIICSAAFTGIELNQVARAAVQLGAKFDGEFRKTTSVLICKDITSMRKEKLRVALKWGIPVVSADWFWECIRTGFKVPLDDYIFPEIKERYSETSQPEPKPTSRTAPEARLHQKPMQRTHSEPVSKSTKSHITKPLQGAGVDTSAFDHDSPEKVSRKMTAKPASVISPDFVTARTHQTTTNSLPKDKDFDSPLAEVPQARLNRSPSPTKHTTLPRTRSNSTSKVNTTTSRTEETTDNPPTPQENIQQAKQQENAEQARLRAKAAERQALSSKLTSLIETTTPNLPSFASDETEQPAPRPRKRQLFGRAISNASNASSVASRSAAELHDVFGDEDKDPENQESEPPATQLEYRDDKAKECRAALMSRMMGSGGVGVKTAASTVTQNIVPGPTRTLRKR